MHCIAVNVATERGAGLAGTLTPGENEETDVERHTWRYSAYFANPANDGWMARQAINDLMVCDYSKSYFMQLHVNVWWWSCC